MGEFSPPVFLKLLPPDPGMGDAEVRATLYEGVVVGVKGRPAPDFWASAISVAPSIGSVP